MDNNTYHPINKRSIIIPFKHFSQSPESLDGTERNFIGRTRQRAKLIHLLHNAGKRMALLVTGQRGSGKTSFVKYCLDDYSAHSSCRHWYNPSGNSTFELIHAVLYLLAYWSLFIFTFEIVTFFNSTVSNRHPNPTSILKSIIILLPFIGFMLHLIIQHLKNISNITSFYYKYLNHFSAKIKDALQKKSLIKNFIVRLLIEIDKKQDLPYKLIHYISIFLATSLAIYLLTEMDIFNDLSLEIKNHISPNYFYIISALLISIMLSVALIRFKILTIVIRFIKSFFIILTTLILLIYLWVSRDEDTKIYTKEIYVFSKFLMQFALLSAKSTTAIVFILFLIYLLLCDPSQTNYCRNVGILGVLGIALVIIFFSYLEYILIICWNRSHTDEPTLNKEHHTEKSINLKAHHLARSLNEMTFFDQFVKYWKPSANISINLGFDDIDHRRIIRTMLESIKDKYYKIFIARGTKYYISSFLITLFISMLIASSVTNYTMNHIIDVNKSVNIQVQSVNSKTVIENQRIIINETINSPSVLKESFSKELFFAKFPIVAGDKTHKFELQLDPINAAITSLFIPRGLINNQQNSNIFNNYYLNGLYILVIILCYLALYFLKKLLPNFSYQFHYNRITKLINHIDSSIINSSKNIVSNSTPLANFINSKASDTTIKTEPLDTRIIENKFLEILKDIQYINRPYYTLPAPEITFVFDELDKLGSKYEVEARENEPKLKDTLPFQISKREVLIENLLSNLKNIISTASARFIFIGGRELYDAWLADQTDINPLLTSIFSDGIIYIPSLLVDETDKDCTDLINVYFYKQHVKSNDLHKLILESNYKILNRSHLKRNTYYHEPYNQEKIKKDLNKIPIREIVDKNIVPPKIKTNADRDLYHKNKDIFFPQLIKYLSYRSHGKPIKLKQLFSAFILPVASCVKNIEISTSGSYVNNNEIKPEDDEYIYKDYDHIMHFKDIDLIVIQFINGIFNKLENSFNSSISNRDDKVATSIFYLMDFLLKFHKRAFSWDSLEKVDALSDTYKDPDIRMILRHIVDSFSDLLLHKVINGMYSFRFRSNISSELRYISKFSSTEMAAYSGECDHRFWSIVITKNP